MSIQLHGPQLVSRLFIRTFEIRLKADDWALLTIRSRFCSPEIFLNGKPLYRRASLWERLRARLTRIRG